MGRRVSKEILEEIINKVQLGERVADLAEQYAEPEEEISTDPARGAEILEPYDAPNPLDSE